MLLFISKLVVSAMLIGGNNLAHFLARRAVLTVDTDVWLEELPQDLDDVFQSDLSK